LMLYRAQSKRDSVTNFSIDSDEESGAMYVV